MMAKEFAGHQTVSGVPGTKIYFAHPYSSRERGLNENTNGLIRHYRFKGNSLQGLTLQQCKCIEDKLNNRPGKALGF
jgi:IS30 family transposase